jgi:hypothetical protein
VVLVEREGVQIMVRIACWYLKTGKTFVTEPMPKWEALDYLREVKEYGNFLSVSFEIVEA